MKLLFKFQLRLSNTKITFMLKLLKTVQDDQFRNCLKKYCNCCKADELNYLFQQMQTVSSTHKLYSLKEEREAHNAASKASLEGD